MNFLNTAQDAWNWVRTQANAIVSSSSSSSSSQSSSSSSVKIQKQLPPLPLCVPKIPLPPKVLLQVASDYIEVEVGVSDNSTPFLFSSSYMNDTNQHMNFMQIREEIARKKAQHQPKEFKLYVDGEFCAKGPGPIIVIPNLNPEKVYSVCVSAVNEAGESEKSSCVLLKTTHHGIGVDEAISMVKKGAEHISVHSDLDEDSSIKLARHLINIEETEKLKTLMLYGNHCGRKNAAIIAKAFSENCHLHTLLFGRNQVHEEAIATLSMSLLNNKTITSLILVENRIDSFGARHLATLLESNTSLKHLDIRKNPLGGTGGANLANGLQYNDTLTSLDISGCKLGDVGAVEIAKSLRENTCLTTLKMCSNDISGNGALEVARFLGDNIVIKHLALSFGYPQRTEWVARHEPEDPLLCFLPNARKDWLESVLPAWTSYLDPLSLTQHIDLGNDSYMFFLGVILPEIADLLCPSLLETVVDKFVPPPPRVQVEQVV